LGLTPAAVSKSVNRLELRLGVRLFQRSTRSLALTTDGERLYGQVRLPWNEIGDALTDLSQGAGKPAGTLKVSLAYTVGGSIVPLLDEFSRRYPDVVPDLHFDNRQVDLIAEGFDVAIGGGIELTDALIARELARVDIVLAASPAYLKAHAAPETPQELVRHRGLLRRSLSTGRLVPWTLKHRAGRKWWPACVRWRCWTTRKPSPAPPPAAWASACCPCRTPCRCWIAENWCVCCRTGMLKRGLFRYIIQAANSCRPRCGCLWSTWWSSSAPATLSASANINQEMSR
jgi:DNA-binding transcriptional LysR family regulator